MAKNFQSAEFQQESFSGYSSAANKRPSESASREGASRTQYENLLTEYEKKLIREAEGSLSKEEIRSLLCIHNLGELTTQSELEIISEASDCSDILIKCDPKSPFRSIDGSCNNLNNPTQGMADQPFRRLLPPYYEDGIEIPKGRLQANGCLQDFCIDAFDPPSPSARLISSRIVLNVADKIEPVTHMVMQWGQFLDHDLGLAPEKEHEGSPLCASCKIEDDCEPIQIPEDDPVFGNGKGSTIDGKCLTFRRSLGVCQKGGLTPRQQLNDLTSYLDGSQIYGSNEKLAKELRTGTNGLLATSENGKRLPTRKGKECEPQEECFLAGDVRANEQVGLTAMHTLFVREHNRIAKELKRINGMWDDDRLYEETRKIVGALLQLITYDEYLPKVLGSKTNNEVIPKYRGYRSCANAAIPNSFAAAAYRYGHSLIRPIFDRFTTDRYDKGANQPLNLRESFFNIKQFTATGLDAIFRGLVTQNALRNDEFMNSVLTTQLFQRGSGPGMDLAALNIQRGRDHGLPSYGSWVSYCGLQFPSLPVAQIRSQLTLWRLFGVYGSIEPADLFVAGLAEKRISESLLGPTFACLFGITFTDLRDGDRFYYENPRVFTAAQLAEIKKGSVSRIICDNTAINIIQPNAFDSNQARVSCSTLPSIDLSKWRVADVEVQDAVEQQMNELNEEDYEEEMEF